MANKEKFFSPNKPEQGEEMIKNTKEFMKEMEEGHLEKAEAFLNEVRADLAVKERRFPNYDARWLDHRERELFNAFCHEDWAGAKRMVEKSAQEKSKEGRKKRLEELSGKKYEEI